MSNGVKNFKMLRTFQAIIVAIGALNSIFTLISALSQYKVGVVVQAIIEVIVFAYIIIYTTVWYKKSDKYFNTLVYLVSFAILMNSLVAPDFFVTEMLLTLSFGLVLVFAQRMDSPEYAKKTIIIACMVAVLACIVIDLDKDNHVEAPPAEILYETKEIPAEGLPDAPADDIPAPPGEGYSNAFITFTKYVSHWCIPLMIGTIALSYCIRTSEDSDKKKD